MNANLQTLVIPPGGATKLPFTPGKVDGLGLGTATFQDILTDANRRLGLLALEPVRPGAGEKANALQLLSRDVGSGFKPEQGIQEKGSGPLLKMQHVLALGKVPEPVEEERPARKPRAATASKGDREVERIHLAAAQSGLDMRLLDAIIGRLLAQAGNTHRPVRVVLRHESLGKIELHFTGGKQGVRVSAVPQGRDQVKKTQDPAPGFGSRSATRKILSARLFAGAKQARANLSTPEGKSRDVTDADEQPGLRARAGMSAKAPEGSFLRTGLSLRAARQLVGDMVQQALRSKPAPIKLEVAVQGREQVVVKVGREAAGGTGQSTIVVEASTPKAVTWMAKQLRDAGIHPDASVKIEYVVDKQVGNTTQEAAHTELSELVQRGSGEKAVPDSLAASGTEQRSPALSESAPASAKVGGLMRGLIDQVTHEPVFATIRENVQHQLKRLEADLKHALSTGRDVRGEIKVANERQQAQLEARLRPVLARLLEAGLPLKQVTVAVATPAPDSPQMGAKTKNPGPAQVSFPVAEEQVERSGKESPLPHAGKVRAMRQTAAKKAQKRVHPSAPSSTPHEARPTLTGRPAPVTNVTRPQTVDLLQRIAEIARVQSQNTGGKLGIQMNVNHLGRVFVDATRRLHQIELQIQVHSHEVKRLLESQLRPLLSHMKQEGLSIGRVEVAVRDQRQDGLNQRFVSQNQNRLSERFEGFSNPQHRREPRGWRSRPFGYDELLNRTFDFWA